MQETNPKVVAAGWAGAATILIVWIVEELGVDVPPEVASAFTVLIGTGAGWLKADRVVYSEGGGVDPDLIPPERKPTKKTR